MSSLRLALKQSLADAGGNAHPSSDSEENEFRGDDEEVEQQQRPAEQQPPAEEQATTPVAEPVAPEPAPPQAPPTPDPKRRAATDVDWKVLPPSDTVRGHFQSLTAENAREHVAAGLRVKVKFEGSKWYGGTISSTSKDGSKIRIHYDDGTYETEPFPDTENNIVIDAIENGSHEADASLFIPGGVKESEPKKQKPDTENIKINIKMTNMAGGARSEVSPKPPGQLKAKEPAVSTPKRKDPEGKVMKPVVLKSPQQTRPVEDGTEVVKPKKKRGRPRKHPLPAEAAAVQQSNGTEPPAVSKTPKSPKGVKKLSIRIPADKLKQSSGTPTLPNIKASLSAIPSSPAKSPTEKRKQNKRKPPSDAKLPSLAPDSNNDTAAVLEDPNRPERRASQQGTVKTSNKGDSKQQPEVVIPKKKKRQRSTNELEQLDESLRWVACDACGKWRIIPQTASIPKNWYCADNVVYDPKRSSCDVPEQTAKQVAKMNKKKRRLAAAEAENRIQDAGTRVVAMDAGMNPVGRRRVGRPRRAKEANDTSSAAPGSSAAAAAAAAAAEMENLEWVQVSLSLLDLQSIPTHACFISTQCDKCRKWRKIAPHISASDLPEVWTCDMNTWNANSANCDAPEDKADGQQDTVFGNSGSSDANKFTYRHLIFGTTGKRATRPVSERARAAESLFAVQYEEDEAPSKVLYADSSAFVSKGKQNAPLVDETESISVLEVMSKSRLWQDLRTASKAYTHGITPESASSLIHGYTYDNLPENIQQPMKDFVLKVLGSQVLTGDALVEHGKELSSDLLSDSCKKALPYFTLNVAVTTIYELVKDGTVECVRNPSDFTTMYRCVVVKRVKPSVKPTVHRVSRCMKIAKPWKRLNAA